MIKLVYDFTEPVLGIDDVEDGGGLYAILRHDGHQFRPLYVGQTGDFAGRITENHERYDCWIRHDEIIYHALHHAERLHEMHRIQMENMVIGMCDPPCNRTSAGERSGRP